MAALVLVLSERKKLAAATPEVRDNPWLRRIMPAIASLPTPFTRSSGLDNEALLATRPDLVLLWTGNDGLRTRLNDLGIPVLTMGYANASELKSALRTLGKALGPLESQRAEALLAYYDDNLERVTAGLDGVREEARPRVYYASVTPLHTEGRGSMIDDWIDTAGGINVAARAGIAGDATVHLEDVVAWNPQIIVTLAPAQRQAILADARWREIDAVRNARILVCPRGVNAWCTRAAEATLQVLWAAKAFHPERFASLDMAAETRRFYHRFYAYDLNDAEVARVLQGEPPDEATSLPRKNP